MGLEFLSEPAGEIRAALNTGLTGDTFSSSRETISAIEIALKSAREEMRKDFGPSAEVSDLRRVNDLVQDARDGLTQQFNLLQVNSDRIVSQSREALDAITIQERQVRRLGDGAPIADFGKELDNLQTFTNRTRNAFDHFVSEVADQHRAIVRRGDYGE